MARAFPARPFEPVARLPVPRDAVREFAGSTVAMLFVDDALMSRIEALGAARGQSAGEVLSAAIDALEGS